MAIKLPLQGSLLDDCLEDAEDTTPLGVPLLLSLLAVTIVPRASIFQNPEDPSIDELHDATVNVRPLYEPVGASPFRPLLDVEEDELDDEVVEHQTNRIILTSAPFVPLLLADYDALDDEETVAPQPAYMVVIETRTPIFQAEGDELEDDALDVIVNIRPLYEPAADPFRPILFEDEDELDDDAQELLVNRLLEPILEETPFLPLQDYYEDSLVDEVDFIQFAYAVEPGQAPFIPLVQWDEDELDDETDFIQFGYITEVVVVPREAFFQPGVEPPDDPEVEQTYNVLILYLPPEPMPFRGLLFEEDDIQLLDEETIWIRRPGMDEILPPVIPPVIPPVEPPVVPSPSASDSLRYVRPGGRAIILPLGRRSHFGQSLAQTIRVAEFDFTSSIPRLDIIVSQSVTASVYTGVDTIPGALIIGGATTAGRVVSQKVMGGRPGVIYLLLCRVQTLSGQLIEQSVYYSLT